MTDALEPAPTPVYGRWFQAAWPGQCADCDEPIQPGDEIRSDGAGGYSGRCCDYDTEVC